MEEIMNAINKEDTGEDAIKILQVISYFGSDDICTGMFTLLIRNPDDLQRALNLLNENSLVELTKEGTVVRIDKKIQTAVRKYLRDQNMGKTILTLAIRLIISNLTEVSNLYHAISVFKHSKEYANSVQLVEDAAGMASRVILGLMKLTRYPEANAFGFDAFDFAKRTLGENHPATLCIQHNLGTLLGAEGKFEEALELLLPLYEKDMEFSNQSEVIETLVTVARLLSESSRYSEALQYYDRLLRNKQVSNTNDKTLLTAFHDYALLLNDLDLSDKALAILNDLLKKRREVLNAVDDNSRLTMSSIAIVLRSQGKYHEALNIFQQVYDERLIYLGVMHEDTLRTKRDIAVVYMDQSDYDKAFNELSDVVQKFDQVLGELHPDTLAARANLATTLSLLNRLEDAYQMLTNVYEKQKRVLGEHQIETLRVKYNIVSVLLKQGKTVEALRVLREILEGYLIVFGPNHPETQRIQTEISMMDFANMRLNNSVAETIHSYSRDGNYNEVASMIEKGEDVNARDTEGKSPLHYAAEHNHMELVMLLLEKGAGYDAKDNNRKTPLKLARSEEIKELLGSLKTLFANVKAGNHELIGDFHFATEWMVNVKDSTGHTLLHWSASQGHQHIVHLLLEVGADATSVSNKGNSPLHIAVSKGHGEIVQTLLRLVRRDQMSDFINGQTKGLGTTPLHVAAQLGFFEIVKTLLKCGAVYDIRNNAGKVPLQLTKDSNVRNLLLLVYSLFTDARNGSSKMVEKLRDMDAGDLLAIRNARDSQKHTVLQIVLKNEHKELARKLLKIFKEDSAEKQEL